ncbi:hypothetical protein [Paradesulfitobacterium ferrireducens]|uniref:hypothetical protein n=1 Tax=Paradesulfitobacterium ferrireducens TaxID=2816476 RepID=UPI001A908992|nr:hypothetical protein [Paradesulfitobacterium ferrireducens]
MEIPADEQKLRLLAKIEEIYSRVFSLREQVEADQDSLSVIQEAAVVRTCLDELEKLVFERYSRECLLSSAGQVTDEVGRLLVVLNRLFK